MRSMFNVFLIAISIVLTGCHSSEYYRKKAQERAEAVRIFREYEQSFQQRGCTDLRFKFAHGNSFGKEDKLNLLRCLEIERLRNEYWEAINGEVGTEEMVAKKAYEDYRLIFTHLAKGGITLQKARELYDSVTSNSKAAVREEIERKERLAAEERRRWQERREKYEREQQELMRQHERMMMLDAVRRLQQPQSIRCHSDLNGNVYCNPN